MKTLKFSILFFVLIASFISETFSQSFYFTYSGPTPNAIPFGESSVNGTFYFNYYQQNATLIRPKLSIQLDGHLLAGAICEGANSYLPSSYTMNFTQGTHTVKFTLSDLGQQ